MSASALNGIRRELADKLEEIPCLKKDILNRTDEIKPGTGLFPFKDATYKANISNLLAENVYKEAGANSFEKAYEIEHQESVELMRTRYCIRHELGLCPKQSQSKDASSSAKASPLYLLNNGQRFTLVFDCRRCEMVVKA
jgi:putative protease